MMRGPLVSANSTTLSQQQSRTCAAVVAYCWIVSSTSSTRVTLTTIERHKTRFLSLFSLPNYKLVAEKKVKKRKEDTLHVINCVSTASALRALPFIMPKPLTSANSRFK